MKAWVVFIINFVLNFVFIPLSSVSYAQEHDQEVEIINEGVAQSIIDYQQSQAEKREVTRTRKKANKKIVKRQESLLRCLEIFFQKRHGGIEGTQMMLDKLGLLSPGELEGLEDSLNLCQELKSNLTALPKNIPMPEPEFGMNRALHNLYNALMRNRFAYSYCKGAALSAEVALVLGVSAGVGVGYCQSASGFRWLSLALLPGVNFGLSAEVTLSQFYLSAKQGTVGLEAFASGGDTVIVGPFNTFTDNLHLGDRVVRDERNGWINFSDDDDEFSQLASAGVGLYNATVELVGVVPILPLPRDWQPLIKLLEAI